MNKIFWLREGRIAGRAGPNREMWNIEEIKKQGFVAILSVNDGDMVHESLIEHLEMNYAIVSMSPNAPIRKGDKEVCLANLPIALAFISASLSKGPVLIHCSSGKDRTGLVMAANLMLNEGLSVKAAMDEVLRVRPIAFSAEGWMVFGQEVLQDFEKTMTEGQ